MLTLQKGNLFARFLSSEITSCCRYYQVTGTQRNADALMIVYRQSDEIPSEGQHFCGSIKKDFSTTTTEALKRTHHKAQKLPFKNCPNKPKIMKIVNFIATEELVL